MDAIPLSTNARAALERLARALAQTNAPCVSMTERPASGGGTSELRRSLAQDHFEICHYESGCERDLWAAFHQEATPHAVLSLLSRIQRLEMENARLVAALAGSAQSDALTPSGRPPASAARPAPVA